MLADKLTKEERGFLRALYDDGFLKIGADENTQHIGVAKELQARGFIRSVRAEAVAEDSYMVLSGRGLVVIERTV